MTHCRAENGLRFGKEETTLEAIIMCGSGTIRLSTKRLNISVTLFPIQALKDN